MCIRDRMMGCGLLVVFSCLRGISVGSFWIKKECSPSADALSVSHCLQCAPTFPSRRIVLQKELCELTLEFECDSAALMAGAKNRTWMTCSLETEMSLREEGLVFLLSLVSSVEDKVTLLIKAFTSPQMPPNFLIQEKSDRTTCILPTHCKESTLTFWCAPAHSSKQPLTEKQTLL